MLVLSFDKHTMSRSVVYEMIGILEQATFGCSQPLEDGEYDLLHGTDRGPIWVTAQELQRAYIDYKIPERWNIDDLVRAFRAIKAI